MNAAKERFPQSPFTLLSSIHLTQNKPFNFNPKQHRSKCFLVAILISVLTVTATALGTIQPSSAQTPPSTPEFTLHTHTSANGTTITLTIQNQPYDPANYPNSGFFYNVRMRTSGGNWTELYTAEDWYPQMSGADTVLNLTAGENAYWPRETSQGHPALPASGAVEFEVQAMIGHRDRGNLESGTMIMPYVFVGVTSDWSHAQTVNLNISQTSPPSSTPNPPSGKPDASSWVFLTVLVLAVLLAAALLIHRRSRG